MTKRRPHWTDDLIDAVFAANSAMTNYPEDAYPFIAAVEDWEKDTFTAATAILVERIEKAETAIQAVRELCEAKLREVQASDPLYGPPSTVQVVDVLRTLDGEREQHGWYDHERTDDGT